MGAAGAPTIVPARHIRAVIINNKSRPMNNNNDGEWMTQGRRRNLGRKIIQRAEERFLNISRNGKDDLDIPLTDLTMGRVYA